MGRAKLYKDDGSPRYIRCFQTKRNPTIYRFTVVYGRAFWWGGKEWRGRVFYVTMSDNPFHPAYGFCQHGEAMAWEFRPCGSRIRFQDLPEDCQKIVSVEYTHLWKGGEIV
jgi:hypothetical protein